MKYLIGFIIGFLVVTYNPHLGEKFLATKIDTWLKDTVVGAYNEYK